MDTIKQKGLLSSYRQPVTTTCRCGRAGGQGCQRAALWRGNIAGSNTAWWCGAPAEPHGAAAEGAPSGVSLPSTHMLPRCSQSAKLLPADQQPPCKPGISRLTRRACVRTGACVRALQNVASGCSFPAGCTGHREPEVLPRESNAALSSGCQKSCRRADRLPCGAPSCPPGRARRRAGHASSPASRRGDLCCGGTRDSCRARRGCKRGRPAHAPLPAVKRPCGCCGACCSQRRRAGRCGAAARAVALCGVVSHSDCGRVTAAGVIAAC